MKKILVIAGPTAVGKTSLSIALAQILDGEIVSADSMQIYKTLDIGTAKPTIDERSGIPHHMLDVCDPSVRYSVADYVYEASAVIRDIISRGKLPIVVGGTGLYIDHLLYDTSFEEGNYDAELRSKLTQKALELGGSALKSELAEVDPESAERLHDNDIKRIVRALEFYYVTGKTITEHNKNNAFKTMRFSSNFFVLYSDDRELLYNRINERVDIMMQNGLLEEAERVCKSDWFSDSTAAQAIGYKEFLPYFNNEASLDNCIGILKQHSRNYAKRQLTWFRAKQEARFIDINSNKTPLEQIISIIRKA